MTTQNTSVDTLIETLELKLKDLKENNIKTSHTPLTNSKFELLNMQVNLLAAPLVELIALLGYLDLLAHKIQDLGVHNTLEEIKIGNYTIDEWEHDILNQINVRQYNDKQRAILELEQQLKTLLSTEMIRQRQAQELAAKIATL